MRKFVTKIANLITGQPKHEAKRVRAMVQPDWKPAVSPEFKPKRISEVTYPGGPRVEVRQFNESRTHETH